MPGLVHGAGSGVCSPVSSELSTWQSVLRGTVTSAPVSPVPRGAVSGAVKTECSHPQDISDRKLTEVTDDGTAIRIYK